MEFKESSTNNNVSSPICRLAKIASALFLAVLCACSSDSPSPDEPKYPSSIKKKIEVSLSASRASDPNVSDNEKINTWWMAFVNKRGIVEQIIERPASKDPVEMEDVDAEVPVGSYTIYAFANIHADSIKKHIGVFTVGSSAPDISTKKWADFPDKLGKGEQVPMSGFKEINVSESVNQRFSVEVVRMFAKMTLKFSSEASEDIDVRYVTLSPMPLGADLPILPDYGTLGSKPGYIPAGKPGDMKYEFDGGLLVKPEVSEAAQPVSDHFYFREAISDGAATGRFTLGVGLSRGSRSEEQMYTLTAKDFTYFNRNDHVIIPILFTDYIVGIEAMFYPPIGGYPAMIIEEKNEQFYVKFGTGGTFVITPRVKSANQNAASPSKSNITVKLKEIEGDKDIFEKEPKLDGVTGEITGVLDNSKDAKLGTAAVTLDIEVKISETVSRTYTRTIYIIRDKSTTANS